MTSVGYQSTWFYPWEEEAGIIAEEIIDGEIACLDAIRKGGAFEVGEPFQMWRHFTPRKWEVLRDRDKWKVSPAPPPPPPPSPPRKRTFFHADAAPYPTSKCAFCGHSHRTQSGVLRCMDVYWSLYRLHGNKTPPVEEVAKYLGL